jgi:cytidylate kinase
VWLVRPACIRAVFDVEKPKRVGRIEIPAPTPAGSSVISNEESAVFRIITVEREYGAGGSLVAAELAHRTGWQLLDQQLTGDIAKMAAVDQKTVARCDEKVDTLMHRLAKVFWRGSYERALPVADHHIFDADMMVDVAHRLIEQKAESGNCVIVGRGGPYILRSRPDTFRVFVYGSREEKIKRMIRLKMSEAEATAMVDTIDRERAAFVRKYFNAEWPCRSLYHMLISSDSGLDFVCDTIMHALNDLERRHSHQSGHGLHPQHLPAV